MQNNRQKVGQICTKSRCLSRIRRVVILWDKMPLSKALACGLEDDAAGRQFAAPPLLYFRPPLA